MDIFARNLLEKLEEITVIDAHSHLPTEEEALASPADLFHRLLCTYTLTNAQMANTGITRQFLQDISLPLETRWQAFSAVYPFIAETGYLKAARYSAMRLYGCDISDETYAYIDGQIKAQNKPGFFEDILWNHCRIETVINQGSWRKGGRAVFINRDLLELTNRSNAANHLRAMLSWLAQRNIFPTDYTGFSESMFDEFVLKEGFLGVKLTAALANIRLSKAEKTRDFDKLRLGILSETEGYALGMAMIDDWIALCGKHNLVVPVHCGIGWAGGGPYGLEPAKIAPYIARHKNTKFDLYHASLPWIRETAALANQIANVYVNLTWAHQISPAIVVNSLNEWMDIIPANKIIAFGSDASTIEKVFGPLRQTKENIALALAARAGAFGLSQANALALAKLWFYDNPKTLYGL